jgi:geranylgeranyl diphosphate synthase, type II
MSATAPLATWLDARRARVEAALVRYLPAPPQCPAVVHAAMEYSLLAGGKRLRPLLTLAAAEAVSGSDVDAEPLALPAACAIEMIHTYSLIHDDLPAMDDDSLRRGRPTSHVVFGEGQAILAGDGLLTEAFALLAREPRDEAYTARKLKTIGVIAQAAGAIGMVGGQAIDLAAARPHDRELAFRVAGVGASSAKVSAPHTGTTFDAEALRDMHARKTGALIRAAAVAGAVMAGASADAEAAIAAFATDLGLAFQIVDDILDVEGTAADLGKTAGKDAASGKPTYPALFGLARSKELAKDAIDRANATLTAARIGGRLPDIAAWVVGRNN